jgi:hypothetical protein
LGRFFAVAADTATKNAHLKISTFAQMASGFQLKMQKMLFFKVAVQVKTIFVSRHKGCEIFFTK